MAPERHPNRNRVAPGRHHGTGSVAMMPQLTRRSLFTGLAWTAATATLGIAACDRQAAPRTGASATASPGGDGRTLVLYDTTGQYGHLGELYATQAANLVSRFGRWAALPVGRYTARKHLDYDAVVYLGSTYDEPLPAVFLDDVAGSTVPVIWAGANVWQLTARHRELSGKLGFAVGRIDTGRVVEVRYRGTTLTRDPANSAGLVGIQVWDPARATVLADAVRADGTSVPWAVRSGTMTYLSELPFIFAGPGDRYLCFADLLFDALAPDTPVRHRALVRIEDVGPESDPAQLRAIAGYLSGERVPFSVAVYAEHRDATGANAAKPVVSTLSGRPKVVAALKEMATRGGSLIMHGHSHGYAGAPNPYGLSGDDFEFYRAHVDANDVVVLDGPVPEDSAAWAAGRLAAARQQWSAVGLPLPRIWEFPHYAASATDYRTISAEFAARYESPMYFSGVLSGGRVDHTRWVSQFFPYPVRDVYGTAVLPESLGNVALAESNQHGVRTAADIVAAARRQLVVRDGVASFFYHPFLGVGRLKEIVDGLRDLGYTFVPAGSLIAG